MEDYIKGNKEAWEEAFDRRDPKWGEDIVCRIRTEEYPFFTPESLPFLKSYDLKGRCAAQFCCNNGRELLSLVKNKQARKGVGFDIAENQIAFANEKARELDLPCDFIAVNILDMDTSYDETFDFALLTIGALCWFKDLDALFAVISRTLKKGAKILIEDQHPFINMIDAPCDETFDPQHPKECKYSYFEKEWRNQAGMDYMVGHAYPSKTFTDYTHALSAILGGLCRNGFVITAMQEFDYNNLTDMFTHLNHQGFPLSMLIEGRKE